MKSDVQIVIPMTGNGSRFKQEGYGRLKPFIKVHDVTMVEWVTRIFPGYEDQITFICRGEHLDTIPYVSKTLEAVAPASRVLRVDPWTKLGPVNDVMQVVDCIDLDAPVIVAYCDFFMLWDFEAFLAEVIERDCDGAIPCYSGFHPHLNVPENLYASCKTDSLGNLIEIREKYSWTDDKANSKHSPGVYYFKSGHVLKKYFKKLIDNNDTVQGEYYASLPYNYMVADEAKVWCPVNVDYFCQWGTPADLQSYELWIEKIFKRCSE